MAQAEDGEHVSLQDDLEAIEERAKAATPGPWEIYGMTHDHYLRQATDAPPHTGILDAVLWADDNHLRGSRADKLFLATASTDVPALVEMVRMLITDPQADLDWMWAEAKRRAGG